MKEHNSILNSFSNIKRKRLKKQETKAFTLVELIVVITILAVLSTIGFVSYSGYLAGTRDAARIASLKAISEGLELYSTRHNLPNPDEATTQILDNGTQIATQGYVGKNVLETITYSTEGTDPKDGTYYSYYLTRDKKYFQLMAFLEEEENLNSTANAVDYSTRYPTVFGKKLGILVDSNNTPIQELTGSIDISDVGDLELKAYLKDYDYLSGSGTTFQPLATFAKVGGKFCSVTNKTCTDPNDLVIPIEGLLSYYPLNNNAHDEFGENNGLISGDVKFDGVSASFDGDSDIIDISDINLSDFTISSWVYFLDAENISSEVTTNGDGDKALQEFVMRSDDKIRLDMDTSGYGVDWSIVNSDWNNKWKYVVGARKGDIYYIYIDGQKLGEDKTGVLTEYNISKFDRGSFYGKEKNLRIYNRALTEEEIGIIYNKEKEDL